ncbi:MAG: hypothetical protein EX267_08405 [Acidimicrobiia bacterium]|nr:MAG: hypothetical protein EX267_08405 [Acidimicrobiia bacterium]
MAHLVEALGSALGMSLLERLLGQLDQAGRGGGLVGGFGGGVFGLVGGFGNGGGGRRCDHGIGRHGGWLFTGSVRARSLREQSEQGACPLLDANQFGVHGLGSLLETTHMVRIDGRKLARALVGSPVEDDPSDEEADDGGYRQEDEDLANGISGTAHAYS